MELRVGIYGEQEEDFPAGEQLLKTFYRSVGIFASVLRFHSVQQLAAYFEDLIGTDKIFCIVLARVEYLPILLPLLERLSNKTDSGFHNVTFELILSNFPYPQDLVGQTESVFCLLQISFFLQRAAFVSFFLNKFYILRQAAGRS